MRERPRHCVYRGFSIVLTATSDPCVSFLDVLLVSNPVVNKLFDLQSKAFAARANFLCGDHSNRLRIVWPTRGVGSACHIGLFRRACLETRQKASVAIEKFEVFSENLQRSDLLQCSQKLS